MHGTILICSVLQLVAVACTITISVWISEHKELPKHTKEYWIRNINTGFIIIIVLAGICNLLLAAWLISGR